MAQFIKKRHKAAASDESGLRRRFARDFGGEGRSPRWLRLYAAFALSLLALPTRAQTALPIVEALPNSPNLPAFRWFASTDPKRGNDDFFLLKPGETRRVPLAAGQLERLWSTAQFPDQIDLTLESGKNRRELIWSGGKTSRGLLADKTYTYFPTLRGDSIGKLDAGSALIATNRAKTPSKWYFQASVRPKNTVSSPGAGKESQRRLFTLQLNPGQEKVVENFPTPGQFYEISVASDKPGAQTFRDLRLKMSFEGQIAVDAPLMSLAGQVAGDELIQNAVADFDGSRLVLRWPMPFDSAQFSLRNDGKTALNLDIGARISSFQRAPSPFRFCAVQLEKTPVTGQPVEILRVKGQGALVGMALDLKPSAESRRRAFAYLEGNEIITADGKKFEGTGTEDFFSSAWYYPAKPFLRPFEGMTQKITLPPSVSAYRLLIPDAIPFKTSLQFDFEHGNGNNAEDINWKYAVMWYQKAPLSLPVSSENPAPNATENAAPVAPNDRWKIGVAVGLGILLGIASAFFKRRRRAK